MTYLSREVFPFDVDWSNAVNGEVQYDVSPVSAGFGAPVYERTQDQVVTGWQFAILLFDEAEIQEFDDWVDGQDGRRLGFWLPVPWEFGRITAGVDATHFKIEGHGLSDWWNTEKPLHVYFTKEGQSPKAALVSGVTGTTEETITVTTSITVDETWLAWRLVFVRFASDTESGTFECETRQHRAVSVVELPEEYASAGTGSRPVWLYQFSRNHGNGTTSYWRYTSFDIDLSDGANTFTAFQIHHDGLSATVQGQQPELSLSSIYSASSPLGQFPSLQMQSPIDIEVRRGVFTAPGTAASLATIWTGRVSSVEFDGARVTAYCRSLSDFTNRRFPRFQIGPKCNFTLYDANTCKAVKATHSKSGTISDVGTVPNEVVITDASLAGTPANHYARGMFQVGTGANVERRMILANSAASSNAITLILSWPLALASNGDTGTISLGCDLTRETCETRFSNEANFGGHPYVPVNNLVINAVETSQPKGNKK